jgi:hypothetical protein
MVLKMAIRRTTPVLLGLFSLITLFADTQKARLLASVRRAAWYDKRLPTFADTLALIRKELWAQEETFCGSHSEANMIKVPRAFMEHLTDALCYAA